MIHTNRCKNCGKKKEEHYEGLVVHYFCLPANDFSNSDSFLDSGIAALDAHKEELYEAAREYWLDSFNADASRRLERVFNQIEKEK